VFGGVLNILFSLWGDIGGVGVDEDVLARGGKSSVEVGLAVEGVSLLSALSGAIAQSSYLVRSW
jgi:hypothetical protein